MFRSTLPGYRHARIRAAAAATAAVLTVACAGCAASSSHSAAAAATPTAGAAAATGPRGSASVGEISITDAYIPQPATADVAAAYFTVAEHGAEGDVLLSAASVPASQASLMQESTTGSAAESMTTLPHGLAIPAQGAVVLGPGGYHLMLVDPASPLTAGGSVTLTLRFQRAGSVTFKVPVTSLLSDAVTSPAPSEAAGMGNMPGM
jgi:copper(I)-binding protein